MGVRLFPLAFRVERHDRHRPASWLAVGGLAVGAAMAVFGLPPVDVHGVLHYVGIMDPMCGGTRSVWSAMSGDFAMSWRYNPVGIPLVLGAVATLARLLVGALSGRWLNVYVTSVPVAATVAGVLFLALGVNQQLHADLLRTPADEFTPIGPLINALPIVAAAVWVTLKRRRLVHQAAAQARASGRPG